MQTAPPSLSKFALTSSLTLAATAASHAAVVTTLTNPVTLSSNSQANTLSFNLATGQVLFNTTDADSQFQINYDGGGTNGSKIRLTGINGAPATVLYTGSSNGSDVVNTLPGGTIGPGSGGSDMTGRSFVNGSTAQPYLSFSQDAGSQFRYGVTGYAAMQILDPNNANQVDYGQAAITVNADNSVTLSYLAYENTGATFNTIPEPSTVATSLLALGGAASALVARRRRAVQA